ncbi:MAG: hypothetical protein IJ195_04950 [Lachnospiraceae bacterium]|nr:hypothetical protein [Lachnospiraceae bacterium]
MDEVIIDNSLYDRILSGKRINPADYKAIPYWALSANSGYFIFDDRPDENGKYTDNGRIPENAWDVTCIYDGVLG